jgi:hypothetical protein
MFAQNHVHLKKGRQKDTEKENDPQVQRRLQQKTYFSVLPLNEVRNSI